MAHEQTREAIAATFAALIAAGAIDVVPAEDGSGLEIQADQWTLAVEGEPVVVAFLAIDDEPADAAGMRQALAATLAPDDLAALRALDVRWAGALGSGLQASRDPLSMQLATMLTEEPTPASR